MDATDPTEGRPEAGAELDGPARKPRPLLPADGEVVVDGGMVSFWCGRCTCWVDAHIDVHGAKRVHERICHPR